MAAITLETELDRIIRELTALADNERARAKVNQSDTAQIAQSILDNSPEETRAYAKIAREETDCANLKTTTIEIVHWYNDGIVLTNLKALLEERGLPVKSVTVVEGVGV